MLKMAYVRNIKSIKTQCNQIALNASQNGQSGWEDQERIKNLIICFLNLTKAIHKLATEDKVILHKIIYNKASFEQLLNIVDFVETMQTNIYKDLDELGVEDFCRYMVKNINAAIISVMVLFNQRESEEIDLTCE